jgi:hypothetical protein
MAVTSEIEPNLLEVRASPQDNSVVGLVYGIFGRYSRCFALIKNYFENFERISVVLKRPDVRC